MLDGSVLAMCAAIVAVLYLLSLWQRRIAEAQREETEATLYLAKERGMDQVVAQHPQIDAQACIGCGSCVAACPESGVLGLVMGVAQVIHASRCIGHARCAEACPVGAIQVGLGDLAERPDIPVLSESLETSTRGIYIAGELGGLALIRIAAQQAVQAVDHIADDLDPAGEEDPERMDVLIIGAGPAGIAAALRAQELGLSYVAIDQDDIGGTVRKYPRRKLTLTGPMTLPLVGPVKRTEFLKEELIGFWEDIIQDHDLDLRTGVKMTGITGVRDDFLVHTNAGEARARRVLLALGRRGTPRRLGIPGEDRENVLYQLRDAATYQDRRILVVGGGDSAIEAATALADQPGNEVTLSYRKEHFFRLKERNQQRVDDYAARDRLQVVYRSQLQQVEDGQVTLRCETGDASCKEVTLPNDDVFLLVGGEAPLSLLRGLGIRMGGDPVTPTPAAPELQAVES